jgi:hypothetical protein
MLCSALYHIVFLRLLFLKFFITKHELLSRVYIGFIKFWTSVVDHVYKTLDTFSLVFL